MVRAFFCLFMFLFKHIVECQSDSLFKCNTSSENHVNEQFLIEDTFDNSDDGLLLSWLFLRRNRKFNSHFSIKCAPLKCFYCCHPTQSRALFPPQMSWRHNLSSNNTINLSLQNVKIDEINKFQLRKISIRIPICLNGKKG